MVKTEGFRGPGPWVKGKKGIGMLRMVVIERELKWGSITKGKSLTVVEPNCESDRSSKWQAFHKMSEEEWGLF